MHFKDDISAKLTFFYIFQVFQKFVEIGRVAVIAGEGKIAAIVDVIDQVCPLLHIFAIIQCLVEQSTPVTE